MSTSAGKIGAASRAAAAAAVDAVIHNGRSLEQVIPECLTEALSPRDVTLVKALVYGALRGHCLHQCLISKLLSKPLKKKDIVLESLLSVSLFQLLESDQPDFAVVSATVDAAAVLGRPHARGLVNAVLRNFLRQREVLLKAAMQEPAARYRLPVWLLDRLRSSWPDTWEAIAAASNLQAPMWIRVNQQRTSVSDYQQQLKTDINLSAESSAVCPGSLKLESAVRVDVLPGFESGHSSVQDIAAQLAATILAPKPGEKILDACAAPGGKTGHLAELSAYGANITALDHSAERMQRVTENLERIGANATLIVGDAAAPEGWWDGELFDRVLLDAPCSATGVIRRHPDIPLLRRDSDISALTDLQERMLAALWLVLKPGGQLLYTTCSVLPVENQSVVAAFLQGHPEARVLPVDCLEHVAAKHIGPGHQLLPGNPLDSDGFYYALLEKAAE